MEELNIIRKAVWSFVKRYPGLDYEDLEAEAFLAYIEAEKYYTPARGKKSTYIWKVVKNRINTILLGSGKETPWAAEAIENLLPPEPNPEQALLARESWEELLAGLSPEAQTICYILLEEKELFLPTDKPKQCRGILARELKDRGWSWGSIWGTFREIKEGISIGA